MQTDFYDHNLFTDLVVILKTFFFFVSIKVSFLSIKQFDFILAIFIFVL